MLRTEHDERRVTIDVQDEDEDDVGHPMEAPPGVVSAFEATGKEYFFTPGELLVAREDVQRVLEFLREGNIGQPLEITARQEVGNVVRLTVGGLEKAENIPMLVEELRNLGPRAPVVGPNHFFFGHNHVWWHSAEPPNPAASHEPIPDRENLPGHGTLVAVLDTGARNPWFPATVSGAADPVTEAPDGSLAVDAGHGTFVTGVVLQYAPGAEVVVVRIQRPDDIFRPLVQPGDIFLDLLGKYLRLFVSRKLCLQDIAQHGDPSQFVAHFIMKILGRLFPDLPLLFCTQGLDQFLLPVEALFPDGIDQQNDRRCDKDQE